jgi:quercetin 2,3-dioxygenase
MVVGGLSLGERLVMWWNFTARFAAEIASARESWMGDDGRLGPVAGYDGDPFPPRLCHPAPSGRGDSPLR